MRAILLCTACVVISGLLIALMAKGPTLGIFT
jgi:hypothetical protein